VRLAEIQSPWFKNQIQKRQQAVVEEGIVLGRVCTERSVNHALVSSLVLIALGLLSIWPESFEQGVGEAA
jgi:hypothetical protein